MVGSVDSSLLSLLLFPAVLTCRVVACLLQLVGFRLWLKKLYFIENVEGVNGQHCQQGLVKTGASMCFSFMTSTYITKYMYFPISLLAISHPLWD